MYLAVVSIVLNTVLLLNLPIEAGLEECGMVTDRAEFSFLYFGIKTFSLIVEKGQSSQA